MNHRDLAHGPPATITATSNKAAIDAHGPPIDAVIDNTAAARSTGQL